MIDKYEIGIREKRMAERVMNNCEIKSSKSVQPFRTLIKLPPNPSKDWWWTHARRNKFITATQTLINLLGAVALLIWGMRVARTGDANGCSPIFNWFEVILLRGLFGMV